MNKSLIHLRFKLKNFFSQKKQHPLFLRIYSEDSSKKKNEIDFEEKEKFIKGTQNKQQRVHEESYFYKEEKEQLEALKKKSTKKKNEESEKDKNKD